MMDKNKIVYNSNNREPIIIEIDKRLLKDYHQSKINIEQKNQVLKKIKSEAFEKIG
jgi:hypothetical protein